MAFTLGVVTRRGPRGFWGAAHILILTSVMVPPGVFALWRFEALHTYDLYTFLHVEYSSVQLTKTKHLAWLPWDETQTPFRGL